MRNTLPTILLLTILYLFNGCKMDFSKKKDQNTSRIQSEVSIKNKSDSPEELITKAQKYYDQKEYSKSLDALAELKQRYPDSEECKRGITIEGISRSNKKEKYKRHKAEHSIVNTYNHVMTVEISSNNIDEKVIEDKSCKIYVGIEKDYIVLSGYSDKKTSYKILSSGDFMGEKYYEVQTNLKESTFLFDTKSNSVVWQRIKNDNSGIHVYFTNK